MRVVPADREELLDHLERYYRGGGWPVEREDDLVLAAGPGGVTWIGAAVMAEDLKAGGLGERLGELAERRMPSSGALCPLELLPADGCADELQAVLDRTGLARRNHVAVYSLT